MNTALMGLQGIDCFVYLDDIVVMRKLREYNLKLQPEKYSFLCKEVGFLGHIITLEGIKPEPEKTQRWNSTPYRQS